VNVNANAKQKGRKRGRRRWMTGWVCIVLVMVTGAAWVWPGRTPVWFNTSWCEAAVNDGNVWFTVGSKVERSALFEWDRSGSDTQWASDPAGRGPWSWRWPDPQHCPFRVHTFVVPAWSGVVAAALGVGLCWWPRGGGAPGRKRQLAGGAMLAAGVALAALWVRSGGRILQINVAPLTVVAGRGTVVVVRPASRYAFWEAVKSLQQSASTWNLWSWGWVTDGVNPRVGFTAPVWPFAASASAAGGLLVWSASRARRLSAGSVCPGCGYDLRGLGVGAACPECGGKAT
jgi:hypothetical protein